jgi:hypothetical protein
MDKDRVAQLINEWDPIGLFPYSPKDEYEVEINAIMERYGSVDDVDNLANGIQSIFVERFGSDIYKKNIRECRVIARRILEQEEC